MLSSPVVVGITDGRNLDVVRFALAEAARLDRPLRVVHVVEDLAHEMAFLDDLGHDLGAELGSVPVERVTLSGDAATALLAKSRTACRMILGVGDFALAPDRWSEVAQRVALHAAVPVITIPAVPTPRTYADDVLVAVDEAHPADGQLAYALEAAEQRGAALEVVFGAGVTSDYPGRQQHWNRLEDLVDRWRLLHPTVPIHVTVEGGHPVQSCLEAAAHASLLVVGRPAGKHPRIGSRSVASKILRRARIPVAVVPLDYTASTATFSAPR